MPIIFQEKDDDNDDIEDLIESFIGQFSPVEAEAFFILRDQRTKAAYGECHIDAKSLLSLGTIDVPLDPENSPDYRANRELVENHPAFQQMKVDAIGRRSFSGIVCEFIEGGEKPLTIIGGQHRFEAIASAADADVHELHGVKVYFGLTPDQRLDVQVISNTNIAVSPDLLDRMFETVAGSELRDWCQSAGLLSKGEDFSDKRKRGNSITVGTARNFIVNFWKGKQIDPDKFDMFDTTPVAVPTGQRNPKDWAEVKVAWPDLWTDRALLQAGREYAKLIAAQRTAFQDSKGKTKKGYSDFEDKANNLAVLTAWAYVAGMLQANPTRLGKHYALKDIPSGDPLKADLLAKGRHVTDADAYRGLGYRTDSKERGRFVELFALQAEKGGGVAKKFIEAAISAYHAKQAALQAKELREKYSGRCGRICA